jgi:spore maturation protein CgeB
MKISLWQTGAGFYAVFRKWVTEQFHARGHEVVPLPPRGATHEIGDLIFSMNFSPDLARLAKAIRKPYVGWVWDALVNHSLLNPAWASDYTILFEFAPSDRTRFQKAGYRHAYYLPASTHHGLFPQTPPAKTHALAFVGNCYPSATPFKAYQTHCERLQLAPALGLQALNEFIEETARAPAHRLRDFFVEFMTARHPDFLATVPVPDRTVCAAYSEQTLDFFVNTLLYHEVDIRMRSRLLHTLVPLGVEVWGEFEGWAPHLRAGIRWNPPCDLETDLGTVLASTRIALNISRTISDGANMRSFEIPAAGTFQLALYSDEMAALFEEGREIVLFRTFEEAHDKAAYYLAHETERETIAQAGRRRFLKDHTLARRFDSMMAALRGLGIA